MCSSLNIKLQQPPPVALYALPSGLDRHAPLCDVPIHLRTHCPPQTLLCHVELSLVATERKISIRPWHDVYGTYSAHSNEPGF